MSINDIPEEVLSMIFKMMDLKDLTNICVKVSKKWMNKFMFEDVQNCLCLCLLYLLFFWKTYLEFSCLDGV